MKVTQPMRHYFTQQSVHDPQNEASSRQLTIAEEWTDRFLSLSAEVIDLHAPIQVKYTKLNFFRAVFII
jgi:hypothetical protein